MNIPCPRSECDEETKDGLLCQVDTAQLRNRLRYLPDTFRELETTLTRQARTTVNGGPKARETPMVFDINADEVRTDTINTVTTWIRDLGETYGELREGKRLVCAGHACATVEAQFWADGCDPGVTMPDWCEWLTTRIYRIRGHQAVAELWDEFIYATGRVMRAIDRPPGRVYVCACSVCGKPVFGREDREEVECEACRRVAERDGDGNVVGPVPTYVLADEHERRLGALRGALLPLNQVHTAVEALTKRTIKYRTMQSWTWRKRLDVRGKDALGRELFSVDQALELANREAS